MVSPSYVRMLRVAMAAGWTSFAADVLQAQTQPAPLMNAPSKVTIRRNPASGFELLHNGTPYFAKGAGGSGHLDELVASGGNSIRTWGIESLDEKVGGKRLIDRCHELGITVAAGFWVKHERHGFKYSDQAFVQRQRDDLRAAVRKHKDHPALLIWSLGNEMEGPSGDGSDPAIYKELNHLAAIIKEEDPNHPVMTVIAGAIPTKIRNVQEHYPLIDILGVNAYASAPGVGQALREQGWDKPFMLTEFGPVGHWEVKKTEWGAPIEPTSRDKAATYYATHTKVVEDGKGRCVGTYAFVWGNKQETTSTWFGMFLKTGEKLPTVDAMSRAWTGEWPANRCPRIESFETTLRGAKVKAGAEATATLKVGDPNGDAVQCEWMVVEESADRKEGGDHEATPPNHPECIVRATNGSVALRTPRRPGAYRLFVTVRDGKGGASADNVPFFVID